MYKKLFKRPLFAPNFRAHNDHFYSNDLATKLFPFLFKLMKHSLIHIIVLFVTFQVSISSPLRAQAILERRISVVLSDQKLETALKKIALSADVRLVYNNQIWKNAGKVNLTLTNVMLRDVLDQVLQSSGLGYEVLNDQFIVLKAKQSPKQVTAYAPPIQDEPQVITVAAGYIVDGIVTDEKNEPLAGVTIRIKNGNQVAITDTRGRYTIGVSKPNSIIEFTFLGYKTAETIVNSAATVNLKMQPDPAKLDEVVVIGYGTTTRRYSTGSQAGISAKDLEKQPITNILQALQGRLPGVFITQTNGLPGAGINVQIRGANAIGLNGVKPNRPLYIIDGVPYLNEPINTASNTSTSTYTLPSAEGATSPLNSINPSDIENIEVLKDADATAIYGSRGANGVVLITTKKGSTGKTKFNVNASSGISKVSHFVEMVGTEQYLALRRKAFANNTTNPATPSVTTAPDLLVWDQNANTDFQKLLLGNTAHTNDVNASVSGGDSRTNFYLSGTYHKEGNVYLGDQGYQRGGAKVNLSHSSYDQRFNLSLSAIYSTDKNNITTTDLAGWAYGLPPNFPLYKADGSLNWDGFVNNPLGYLLQTNDNRTSNLISNLTLKYTLLKGLDFKTSLGYSKTDMTQTTTRPLSSVNPAFNPTSGTASYAYNYSNNYILEPQITYNAKVWKGNLSALAGGTYQYKQSRMPYYTSASGFTSDDFLKTVSAASIVSTTSGSVDYKYASLFGRINYNLEGKYILNVNYRRDGSSRFGPNYKYGNFGSVGAAWLFSEESFLKNKLNWFSFGKLRGSYGIVGSDDIDNYGYLDTYTNTPYAFAGSTGLNPSRLANPNYRWEESKKLDIGLELGFFKDRLSFNASYYRNRTGNQLINYTTSTQTGFSGYQSNLPATVQNSGLEVSVNTTNIKSKIFTWTTSFNISKNRNKLLSFPDIEKSSYFATYLVGNPISSYYLYQFTGIDPATNRPAFTDFNNVGGTASPTGGFAATGRGDRYYAGTSYPSFYGGLTNAVTYKGLTLDFTFQFVKQKGRSLLSSSFYPPGYFSNAALSVVDEYLALGSQDFLVSAGTRGASGSAAYQAYSSYTSSDASLVDASFIRMKNVSLSYILPNAWLTKVNAQTIRVYMQAQNLFTITNYKGFDPESQGVVTPPLRTIVAGLQFTF